MYRKLIGLFICLTIVIISEGQKPPLIFHNLSIHDGLSENSINTIIEDKTGYMWFGTYDGLNKYDGNKFTIYKSVAEDSFSISNRGIKGLFIDSKSNLWVSTTNGLNLYDPKLDRFYNYKNNKYPALKTIDQDIVGITEDNNHELWVATINNGIFHISSLKKQPTCYMPTIEGEGAIFQCVLYTYDDKLLVATKDGLLEFNMKTHQYSDLRSKYGEGYEVRKLFKDKKENIWLCTSDGLKKISKDGQFKEYFHSDSDPYSIKENGVIDIISYGEDKYMVGTNSSAIDFFDASTEKFYHYFNEVTSNNINVVYRDSKGDLWVGSYLNGLDYSNSTTNLFYHQKNNPYSNQVVKNGIITRFLKDSKGNLWITTDGGGLFCKKKGSDNVINCLSGKSGLNNNVLISIFEDPDGEYWISSYGGGLFRYNPVTNTIKNYRNNKSDPTSLFNDFTKDICYYDEKIWISGYDLGIGIFDKKTEKFKNIRLGTDNKTLRSNWVQLFFVDKHDQLWLGTFNGLSKYNAKDKTFTNYLFNSTDNSATTDINSILEIYEDSKGNFWLGTMGSGLVLFNRGTGTYKIITTKEGLSDNMIKSIVEDDYHNLWLGTNDGITKFNIETFKAKPYTIKDGVPYCSYHFNARYKDESGRIYLGANNGIVIVNPAMTNENKIIPPVVITDFKIFNRSVVPGEANSPLKTTIDNCEEIVLPYNKNSISFEFASLNFNSPKNNKFAYYLEGFDKTWFYVGNQRTASYTNLNPGTYFFRVKASNNDNVWNEEGRIIKIIINPPYYQTWWFISLMVLLFLSFLYVLFLWRTKLIRQKNFELEDVVRKRTSQLKEANDQLETFVYKASHDIKGPLKSIIGLTKIGKTDIANGGDPIPYLDHILKSSQKLDELVMDLLAITKEKQRAVSPEKINLRKMVSDILSSFQNFPDADKVKVNVKFEERSEFFSDKQLLTSILQNLIENGLKYADLTKEESYLNVNITVMDKGAYMVFKDNGIGIDKEYHNQIFDMFFKANEHSNGSGLGLFIVKSNIEKLNGTIAVESAIGEGTTFFVKI